MAQAAKVSEDALSPSNIRRLIELHIQEKVPAFIWGPPGIGKSELVAGIAADQNRAVIDMRLLLMEPTDIKGIPYYNPADMEMRWAKPCELPETVSKGDIEVQRKLLKEAEGDLSEIKAKSTVDFEQVRILKDEVTKLGRRLERMLDAHGLQNAILFLDELNSAAPAVQAAAYQLVLNRRVGDYHLPGDVAVLAAGNRETDKGVTYRMPSPLANRFSHYEMRTDFEDWQEWAVNNDVHPDVIGFLSQHDRHLFNFDPKSPDHAFATPRSWVSLSKLLKGSNLPESLERAMIRGCVGTGMSAEFAGHRKVASKMPKPRDVLFGRVKDFGINEMSAMYSLTVSMCYALKEMYDQVQNEEHEMDMKTWNSCVDNFFGFTMKNFRAEMCVLGAKTALGGYKLKIQHRELKNFKEFHKLYGKYILED